MTPSRELVRDDPLGQVLVHKHTVGRLPDEAESGSAPVGFLFTALLSVVLFLMLIQVALTLYTKIMLVDAAGEGARVAGHVGSDTDDGIAKARSLIQGIDVDAQVSARRFAVGETEMVEIRISAKLPVLGALALPRALTATGQGIVEPSSESTD